MRRVVPLLLLVLTFGFATASPVFAHVNLGSVDAQTTLPGAPTGPLGVAGPHFGSSPFAPPDANDATFIVDQSPGLDTGCTFRSGGPLVFNLKIKRVIGDRSRLLANNLIPDHLTLEMPAFDVDFDAVVPGYAPERDIVKFNGNTVEEVYLTGSNNVWKLNAFRIPTEWVNFATPSSGNGEPTPGDNYISIDIDTQNSEEAWCTSIDWASLRVEVPRPLVLVHGIFSSGATWNGGWVPALENLGIPESHALNMGNLAAIGDNAGKIGTEIANSKQRWGVDRVSIGAHSKGGIDSREYAEGHDDVDRLMQLGTPNAGSPLADWAQHASLWALGILPTLLIDLAGPAGLQLTTPYMAGYNAFHGHNANVAYTSIAGDYDPQCFFCWQRPVGALAGRPGDVIVPVWSVHALGYADHRLHASGGGDMSAMHTGMTGTTGMFDVVDDQIRAPGRPLPDMPSQIGTPGASIALASFAGTIAQAATSEYTLAVDGGPLDLMLFYGVGDLDLELISPSGVSFTHQNAPGSTTFGFDDADFFGSRVESFRHAAPEAGAWTVRIHGVSVVAPSGAETYALGAWLEASSIALEAALDVPAVAAGSPFVLRASVMNSGAPLVGGSIVARVGKPDGSTMDIPLLDDGVAPDGTALDGSFAAAFTQTGDAGSYRFALRASGGGSGGVPAFAREGLLLGTAAHGGAAIGIAFADHGLDTNANGLYDELLVDVPVNVATPGRYRLIGTLRDSQANEQEVSAEADLVAGTNTLTLAFDGITIFDRQVDGPYVLANIRLAEIQGTNLLPVVMPPTSHTTGFYSYSAFEHSQLRLTSTGSDQGVDFDNNGLYDLLRVRVGVNVDAAGFYNWSARLTDPSGVEIGFDAGAGSFNVGANEMLFEYPGERIGTHGVDGPYHVRSLLLFGAGRSLVVSDAFATTALQARQFEGFVEPDTTPPQLAVALSPTSSWPPSHELVPVAPTVLVVDVFDPAPVVTLESILSNEAPNMRGDGNTSPDIVYDPTTGSIALRSERSGTEDGRIYTVTWSARDQAGNVATADATFSVPHDADADLTPVEHSIGESAPVFAPGSETVPADLTPRFLASAAKIRGDVFGWNIAWTSNPALAVDRVELWLAPMAGTEGTSQLVAEAATPAGRTQVTPPVGGPEHPILQAKAFSGGTLVSSLLLAPPTLPGVTGVDNGAGASFSLGVVRQGIALYRVRYEIPSAGETRVDVFDVRGALVTTLVRSKSSEGEHAVTWNGTDDQGRRLGAGIYFVRLVHPAGQRSVKVFVTP